MVDNDPILGYSTAQIRRRRLHAIHFPNWTGEGNLGGWIEGLVKIFCVPQFEHSAKQTLSYVSLPSADK